MIDQIKREPMTPPSDMSDVNDKDSPYYTGEHKVIETCGWRDRLHREQLQPLLPWIEGKTKVYYYQVPQEGDKAKEYLEVPKYHGTATANCAEQMFINRQPIPFACYRPKKAGGKPAFYYFALTFEWVCHAVRQAIHQALLVFCATVLDDRPCHVYADLDASSDAEGYDSVKGRHDEVIAAWVTLVPTFWLEMFKVEMNLRLIQWETACREGKFSLHVHVASAAFVNVRHQKRFWAAFILWMKKHHSDTILLKVPCNVLLDLSVYTRHRNFRMVGSHNCKENSTLLPYDHVAKRVIPFEEITDHHLFFGLISHYIDDGVVPVEMSDVVEKPTKKRKAGDKETRYVQNAAGDAARSPCPIQHELEEALSRSPYKLTLKQGMNADGFLKAVQQDERVCFYKNIDGSKRVHGSSQAKIRMKADESGWVHCHSNQCQNEPWIMVVPPRRERDEAAAEAEAMFPLDEPDLVSDGEPAKRVKAETDSSDSGDDSNVPKKKKQRKRAVRRSPAELLATEVLRDMISKLDKKRGLDSTKRKKVIWCIRSCGGDVELAKEWCKGVGADIDEVDKVWKAYRRDKGITKGSLYHWLKEDLGAEYEAQWKQWQPDQTTAAELHQEFDAGLACNRSFVDSVLATLEKKRFLSDEALVDMLTIVKRIGGNLSFFTTGRMAWLRAHPTWNDAKAQQQWDAVVLENHSRGVAWQKLRGYFTQDVPTRAAEIDFYQTHVLFKSVEEAWCAGGNAGLAAMFASMHKGYLKINKKTMHVYNSEAALWNEACSLDLSSNLTAELLPRLQQHRDDVLMDVLRSHCSAYGTKDAIVAPDPMLSSKLTKLRDAVTVLETLNKDSQIVKNVMGNKDLCDPGFAARLNRIPNLLPVKTKLVVNLSDLTTRARTKEDLFMSECPFTFTRHEKYPVVDAFIASYWPGDTEMPLYMQTTLGYCITGYTDEKKSWFWVGLSGAGKTTAMTLVSLALGETFCVSVDKLVFMTMGAKKNPSAATPELMCMVYARVLAVPETDEGDMLNESFFKRALGGDPIPARPLFGDTIYFIPMFKPVVYTNSAPKFRSEVQAVANKIEVVPFERQFVNVDEEGDKGAILKDEVKEGLIDESKNKDIVAKLKTTYLDQFGSWLCEGAYLYLQNRGKQSQSVEIAKESAGAYGAVSR